MRAAHSVFTGIAAVLCAVLTAWAASFSCKQTDCGLHGDNSYPNLVIGVIDNVADAAAGRAIFEHARQRGWWQSLPADASIFFHYIQPVVMTTRTARGQRQIVALMSRSEFNAMPLQKGDLVRYMPHTHPYPTPASQPMDASATAMAAWRLHGCVMALCRTPDAACKLRYRPGIYRKSDGKEVTIKGAAAVTHAGRIDPSSYLPVDP